MSSIPYDSGATAFLSASKAGVASAWASNVPDLPPSAIRRRFTTNLARPSCERVQEQDGQSIFCFASDEQIANDYRDAAQQRRIMRNAFDGVGLANRGTAAGIENSERFYFDKLCHVRMPL